MVSTVVITGTVSSVLASFADGELSLSCHKCARVRRAKAVWFIAKPVTVPRQPKEALGLSENSISKSGTERSLDLCSGQLNSALHAELRLL